VTIKVCYITGTRADFGLMRPVLDQIQADNRFELSVLVTGMHCHDKYGRTLSEVEATGYDVCGVVEVPDDPSGKGMAVNMGLMMQYFVPILDRLSPDVVLLLGDRGEMLAGAITAAHMNIFVCHIHGGERSGTIDEPVRHAISKLAHFHFTSTPQAAERLVRMGERKDHVYQVGAPGLDGITELATIARNDLMVEAGLEPSLPVALMLYHPVLQEEGTAYQDTKMIVSSLLECGLQVVVLEPNSDAGREDISRALSAYRDNEKVKVYRHLPRRSFLSWMAGVDLMIGNSSAGIIESGSFGTPVINIGTRQALRERNINVHDISLEDGDIKGLIGELVGERFPPNNIYGEGKAAQRIVKLMSEIELNPSVLSKSNAY